MNQTVCEQTVCEQTVCEQTVCEQTVCEQLRMTQLCVVYQSVVMLKEIWSKTRFCYFNKHSYLFTQDITNEYISLHR